MGDRWFVVWQRTLVGVSGFLTLFGVLAAVAPFSLPFERRNAAIANHFLGGEWTAHAESLHAFSSGPLGGTMAGFFAIQCIVAWVPLARREKWAWWSIAIGNGLWFGLDSTICAMHGAWFNIIEINLVSLALVGLPLAALIPPLFYSAKQG
ncbi:MAG: hypothetical protein AB8H79_01835 [Myxococcota bacterium]